jgi:uncharacterized membrane protein YphA (DoxX/SURF4 family)
MFKALLRTPNDFAILCVRVALGASLLPHGLEKLGMFDDQLGIGDAMQKAAEFMAQATGTPVWAGYLGIAAEVLGSAALILGVFGRFSALCIGALMAVAAYKVGGIEVGEVLTWWRDKPGATTYGGYHLLAVGASLAILIRGSGALSIDRMLAPKPRD